MNEGMVDRFAGLSPRGWARIVGAVYLLYFATAVLSAVVTPSTSSSVLAHETAFRLGFAIGLVSLALYVAVTALFYGLFKHVDRSLALLAAFFSLVGCAVQAFGSVFRLAPLVVMGGQYKSAFDADQLQALTQMFVDWSTQAGYVGLVFFGLFDVTIGYLIFRSGFLPRILGGLMALAGFGWLAFLSPPLANSVAAPIEVLGFVAEVALMLWLLAMGVNSQRWNERAGAAWTPVSNSPRS